MVENKLSHILVPSFLQLAHLEEAILVWNLYIGKMKSTENRIKRLRDMMLLNINGSPFAIDGVIVDHQYQQISIPTQHVM